jgi:GNAT superfamily N-acetyltransferase
MRSEIATPVDAAALAELLNAADWSLWPRGLVEAEPLPGIAPREVAAMISGSATTILVRRTDHFPMLLGCVAVELSDARVCTISMLAVAAQFRGTAVGRALLEDSEQFAVDRGATMAKIAVTAGHDDMVAWLGRRGYRLTGGREAHPRRVGGGDVKLPGALRFVVLEKYL